MIRVNIKLCLLSRAVEFVTVPRVCVCARRVCTSSRVMDTNTHTVIELGELSLIKL